MSEDRPSPEALLASIERERQAARRGRLKVFFGMCPGVGKTYAMLQAARAAVAAGTEVVLGVVETHGRVETAALLEGLPVAPRLKLEYRGTAIEEMDLDALVLWHPQLVLVDELAHTNAPGARHPKRYQDVLELLEAGIDVFTTVNVQHLESRAETVRQITGIAVRETVPDSVLDRAEEIVLVDLTPPQLTTRLAEGRVYLGERAALAVDHFFREQNLIALREMALRFVAEHVDRDLRAIMQEQRIAGPWKTGDRLLVGVSASPTSEKLIRYTRRLAATMEAAWLAVTIETPQPLAEEDQQRLERHLTLARKLGAEVISTSGVDIGETLLRVARQHNSTQIVIGKPVGPAWRRLFTPSPVDWLLAHSGDIDLCLVRAESLGAPRPAVPRRTATSDWAAAFVTVAGTTLVGLFTLPWIGYRTVALIYLLGVVLAASRLRRTATALVATLSALLWDFLFIPPHYTFYVAEVHDIVMLGMLFFVALVIGTLTARLRERERAERHGEERATALYRIAGGLATSAGLADAVKVVGRELDTLFRAQSAVLLAADGELNMQPGATLPITEKELSVAGWAFQQKQAAGRFTDTLPDAEALHLPLLAGERSEGVLLIRPAATLTHQQRELLGGIAAQLAMYVAKERALAANRAAQVEAQSERLQKALFDSISHELKTPLAVLSAALEQPQPDTAEMRQAVRRLTRTVGLLLDATRIESGQLQLRREWCEPGELAVEALALAETGKDRVEVQVAADTPLLLVDAGLFAQALSLLLANAVQYSPAESPITLTLTSDANAATFAVLDRGPGFGPGEEVRAFEKFHRGSGHGTGGLGLGLAIARQLVEAHGGTIGAQNRDGGGARVWIRLPVTQRPQLPPP
ncbi:MAG: sensor histidine kinase KdpD [Chthoniobacteraceae bacterium]